MRLEYGRGPGRKRKAPSRRSRLPFGMTLYGCLHLIATILISLGCAAGLFLLLGNWMSSVILRVLIVVLPTLIGGFLLLVISDRMLQALFGLEAFEDDE